MHKKYVHFKRDLNRRKRAAQNSAERRVDREGWGKAETQSEHLPLSKKHSQGKQSACFSAEEEKRLQGGWVRRGRRRSSEKGKSSGLFEHPCGRKKRRQRALNAALPLLDGTKNSALRRRSFCTASLQKLKKGKGNTLVFALGFSALPLAIDDSF